MQKFESEIKQLSAPQVRVYEKFSDLRNLQALRERLNDPLVQEKMQAALSDEQVAEAKKQLETLTFDADNVTIQSPVGQVTLTVVEREEPKLIKFESAGSPVPLNLWILIMPSGEGSKLPTDWPICCLPLLSTNSLPSLCFLSSQTAISRCSMRIYSV